MDSPHVWAESARGYPLHGVNTVKYWHILCYDMPPRRPPTQWDPDLADPAIRRWVLNLKRGSVATGDSWFRALRRFCGESQHTAQDLLTMSPKALQDLFIDFVELDERRGVGGSFTAYTLKVARNWLRFNGVAPPAGVKVKDADVVFEETALTIEKLRAALNAATPRDRVAIVLMAQSGVRPEVIGDFEGKDGLRLKDFPELVIAGKSVTFSKSPAIIRVRRELSKTTHRYLTFIGSEGAGIITDWLQSRLSAGETLTPDSPLYTPDRPDMTERAFMRTTKIGDNIRRAFRSAGIMDRPYVLRTTAASRFSEAENKGLVSHSYWQFWMGHAGDIDARYSVNRGGLPQSTFDEMRAAYHRCEALLSTSTVQSNADENAIRFMKILLQEKGGLSAKKVEKMDLSSMSDDEIAALLRGRTTSDEAAAPIVAPKAPRQALFAPEAVEKMLAEGWRYLDQLKDGHVVMQAPSAQ